MKSHRRSDLGRRATQHVAQRLATIHLLTRGSGGAKAALVCVRPPADPEGSERQMPGCAGGFCRRMVRQSSPRKGHGAVTEQSQPPEPAAQGKPRVELVSQNSAESIARHEAATVAAATLREMAANVLRVVRGAGQPYALAQQAPAFVAALAEYRGNVGFTPIPIEAGSILSFRENLPPGIQETDDQRTEASAEDQMVRGALQIAASRLLGQRTHEYAGHQELRGGFYELEALRARWQNERMAAEAAAARPKAPRGRGKPARKRLR